MSTLQNKQSAWPMQSPSHISKYEKCLNITEEIYKRINITFEIKKLESCSQSDVSIHSDQIDSSDLSNETDLFAYEKSSSISSSTSDLTTQQPCEKFISLNNNEESKFKKSVPFATNSKPKKRFRKRVKKRQTKSNASDTDCSSDEQLPLSRIVGDSKSDDEGSEVKTPVPIEVDNVQFKEDVKENGKAVLNHVLESEGNFFIIPDSAASGCPK